MKKTPMRNTDLENFKKSLAEGVKYARGQKAHVRVETLHIRAMGSDVKDARQFLGLSQPQFARLMVVSSETVKKWEQNKNPIPAAIGYWLAGLKIRPKITKPLLLEMASLMIDSHQAAS